MNKKILNIFFLLIIHISTFPQLILPGETRNEYFNKIVRDSIFKLLHEDCNTYGIKEHCLDISKLSFDFHYQLIFNKNTKEYDTAKSLIYYVEIDTILPGVVFIYNGCHFIGIVGTCYKCPTRSFSTSFTSIADLKGDRVGLKSLRKFERAHRYMLRKNPEIIFHLSDGIIAYGYIKDNQMYFFDINTEKFLAEDVYLTKYNLHKSIKYYFENYFE